VDTNAGDTQLNYLTHDALSIEHLALSNLLAGSLTLEECRALDAQGVSIAQLALGMMEVEANSRCFDIGTILARQGR